MPAPPLESDNVHSSDREVLRRSHFEQPWRVRFWPLLLVVVVSAVYLSVQATAWLGHRPAADEAGVASRSIAGATALFALGAFIVGYHQWRAARRESSMDQYYSRLHIANQQLAVLEGVRPLDMYVFSELDNLEYVIEKYRLGYMDARQALRGLETFQRRLYGLKGSEFAAFAEVTVARSGYNATTRRVVQQVVADWRRANAPSA